MDIPKPQQQQPLITLEDKYASRITVVETVVGKAIQATEPIAKGTHLYPFAGKILNAPNMHTVQLDATRHILCVGGPEFTAHSCDPNAYFMFVGDAVTLVAIKDIRRGELISFNYCTTEWDMAEKFPCACKAEHCFGWIKGMKHCDAKQRDIIMPYTSPYIRSKILAEAPVAALPTPAVATLQVVLPASPARDAKESASHSASPTKGTTTPPAASVSASNESSPPRTPSPTARTIKAAPSLSAAVTSNALSALSSEIRSRIEIVESNAGIGKAIQTTTFIPKGTALYPCMGTISSEPDMWTVQLDAKRHIMCLGGPAYTAHSCDPNAYFQFVGDSMTLVAIKDIQPLELVTFNYCTTEWHMSAPFDCVCRSPNCLGAVRGYSHVTEQKLRDLMTPYLSPYIRAKALEAGLITPAAAASIVFVPPTPAATSPVVPREAMDASGVDSKHSHSPSPSHSPVPFGKEKDVVSGLATLSVCGSGSAVPANLYGSTADAYRNTLVTNNAGRAVVQGAAPVAGHTD